MGNEWCCNGAKDLITFEWKYLIQDTETEVFLNSWMHLNFKIPHSLLKSVEEDFTLTPTYTQTI